MNLIERFLSPEARRHYREEQHPAHPRQHMPAMSELQLADAWCAAQRHTECQCMSPLGHTHPKHEPVRYTHDGSMADLQLDTPDLDDLFGMKESDGHYEVDLF